MDCRLQSITKKEIVKDPGNKNEIREGCGPFWFKLTMLKHCLDVETWSEIGGKIFVDLLLVLNTI
jgi:hypothetical protein